VSCPVPVGLDDLIDAIKESKEEAIKRLTSVDDDGPCNMDHAWVRINEGNRISIVQAIKRGGLEAIPISNSGMVMIEPPEPSYTGKKRTVQAEAISEVLERRGFVSGVNYILD
jgi:hypothetical protein